MWSQGLGLGLTKGDTRDVELAEVVAEGLALGGAVVERDGGVVLFIIGDVPGAQDPQCQLVSARGGECGKSRMGSGISKSWNSVGT